MKHILLTLAVTVAFATAASAQTFEVASIRINRAGSAGGEGRTSESVQSAPGSLTMKNVTLLSCLKWAWGMRDFQISGGPDWLSTERYDISAKAGKPSDDAELKLMLQALLSDRFRLGIRTEQKQLPVYALIVAVNSPRLKHAAGTEPAGMTPSDGALEFRNTSMAEFAEMLAKRPLAVDRPVVDETGLAGGFDFSLKFANNGADLKGALEDIDRGTGQSIFTVVREQLGLKLESRKAALPALFVENAVKIPSAN